MKGRAGATAGAMAPWEGGKAQAVALENVAGRRLFHQFAAPGARDSGPRKGSYVCNLPAVDGPLLAPRNELPWVATRTFVATCRKSSQKTRVSERCCEMDVLHFVV